MESQTPKNEFEMTEVPEKPGTTTAMMTSRQAQEVQAAMVVAKKFPRDEATSFDRIMRSCKRKGLAEQAEYTYPRGGTKITGASIRLAEAVAQAWGNIDYGIIEIEQKPGFSEMLAYAWDLETNVRVTKIFTVKHIRDTREKSKELTDQRDIYEATANFGARRVRACILGIIPGDVMDAAVDQCRATLKGAYAEPLEDRFRKMVATFEADFMVSQKQVEEYLGYDIKSVNENDFVRMQGVFRSLRDGMSQPKDFFGRTRDKAEVNAPDFGKKPEAAKPGDLSEAEKKSILDQEKKDAEKK